METKNKTKTFTAFIVLSLSLPFGEAELMETLSFKKAQDAQLALSLPFGEAELMETMHHLDLLETHLYY